MSRQSLTEHQLARMDLFGFLVFPGLLVDRIERITEEFEAVFARKGVVHDGLRRSAIVPFIDESEYLSGLLDDPRIDGILSSLLGADYCYSGSDGNYYTGDTGWHSDTDFSSTGRGTPPRPYVKLAMYLDEVDRDTGALRVVPGSHRFGEGFAMDLDRVLKNPMEHLGLTGDQVPAVTLRSTPGDVVVFNQNTKHSSWGGSSRRRMFTINATPRFGPDELDLLRSEVRNSARFWMPHVYGEAMLASASATRMVHLEQALEFDDDLADAVREAKLTMSEPSRH